MEVLTTKSILCHKKTALPFANINNRSIFATGISNRPDTSVGDARESGERPELYPQL